MNQTALGFTLASLILGACNGNKTTDEPTVLNSTPVADAGKDISQTADGAVTLDGGGSYDPDGDPIAYHWEFDSAPATSALTAEGADPFPSNDTTAATAEFMPDTAGTYVVKLTVSDNHGATSTPDFVVVTITEGESPVANAGADQTGTEGDSFTLDGSASYDPYGRTLAYSWDFASVPQNSSLSSLTGATSAQASFVADKGGVYIASLVVDNGISSSAPDTVIVRVATADPQAPVSIAGDDQSVEDCTAIALDGSGSYDANGDTLSYQWSVQSVPTESSASNSSFADRTSAATTFFADQAGEYVLALSVYDGSQWSTPDLVTLTVAERSYNSAPVVDAGNRKSLDGGDATCTESGYTYACDECDNQTVNLGDDATASDADGDDMTYQWTVVSGDATIADDTALSTTVSLESAEPTEPSACEDNDYQFELTVTDCTGETATDSVTFTVSCCGVEDTSTAR